MHGLAAFHQSCLDQLGVVRHKLVVHDWGALALIAAQRRPEVVERLVAINAVPLLAGYRWHWVARLWRRRGIGELLNATQTRRALALTLRQARGDRSAMPRDFVDMIWDHWNRGTSKAVLRLYRGADPQLLAEAGRDLERIECPALVVWGERDVYLPSSFGRRYAERLANGEYLGIPEAGHWPWIDRPDVVDRVLRFLDESPTSDEGSR
jgi:pimeloyl-ACP methyl ester carboxylesterase